MQLAIDLQPNPNPTPEPLPKAADTIVTFFYLAVILLLVFLGAAWAKRYTIQQQMTQTTADLARANASLADLRAEQTRLGKQGVVAGGLAEWLSMSPPAQALALLLTRDVEPNVSFSRLVVAMDQGQPSFKLVVELVSASHDSATRQINRLQDALDRAGFRTINVDSDGPTPEGWRFASTVALPANGDFSKLAPSPNSPNP
jgi:hypothetical protein